MPAIIADFRKARGFRGLAVLEGRRQHESSPHNAKIAVQHQINGLAISQVLFGQDARRKRSLVVAL
jgi:hypothetical protein